MGEWSWLHTKFPLADIELIADPIDAKYANVIVRTIRLLPPINGENRYEIRVAPHHVAPFQGGPWFAQFTEQELREPSAALYAFREHLACALLGITNKVKF